MNILDNVIILALIFGSFLFGRYISDRYNTQTIDELRYQLRLLSAQKGTGYVAPPVRRRASIGQEFMDKLHENGKAVQKLNT